MREGVVAGKARLTTAVVAAVVALATPVVMRWEGLRTEAYLDIVGVPTICFGHTAKAKSGMVATEQQCRDLLTTDMLAHLAGVERCISAELEPHHWAALLSLSFNAGVSAICDSTLVRMINAGSPPAEWCPQLRRWVYAGGEPVRGLANRREQELALCLGSI